ncbi:MAG: glutamyl-tRNA reductase [Gemmatimonadota bacterium]
MTMELFVVGTSQSVAPTRVRERMHVDLDEVYAALGALLTERGVLEEAVPLATCGRLELYCVARDAERALKLLVRLLARRTGVPSEELRSHIYALRGSIAVRHLFRVASGLDSVVHGEAQILGQVREAAHHPLAMTSKGPILHRVFEMALATGKKVRTETDIGRGAASLASASLKMVEREMGSLGDVRALVIGAGETGGLMARLLRKSGVGTLVVANRTEETAREVAIPLGGMGVGLDRLPELLAGSDLVVGAVTAGEWLVTADMMRAQARPSEARPVRFLDLAHPRNFDPALAEVPGVTLFDLDHVFERVESARAARAAQVPRAEAIVRDQAETFALWMRSRRSVDVLKAVRRQVLDLAKSEAERFGQGRSDEEKEQMRLLARSLARTLLHPPTLALREADPESPEGRFLLDAAPALFGVDPDDGGQPRGSK